MKLSITELIKDTYLLLKKDLIIFGPPIISSFLIYTNTLRYPATELLSLSINSIMIILILLCIYITTFGIGVKMANTLHFNSEIKPSIFKNVLTRYALRLIISALFILPL